ncbi:MAG TPA: fused MFS/spermidine synthase, partial [Candidatus Methylomirabilis sp.]|nr:fused MFS/spermidine synthase [Candidatus Methylomirabilis sp.]
MGDLPPRPYFTGYLLFTALVCGALVMVIEVLGSKVIGPYFGVSLFVWTSLISVTLVSLAAGYAVGGAVSDRRESPDYLYGIVLLAGVLVLFVPLAKIPVIRFCQPLGLRAGALAASAALFGPSLFFLGAVSPYIVRIAAREMASLGRTVGTFYAISTAGSFAGTVLTGFVLIAWFGVSRIFLVVGGVLIALGAAYFLVFRGRWHFLVLLALPFLLGPREPVKTKVLPSGVRVTEVMNRDGFYGNVRVFDYAYGPAATGASVVRVLDIDGQTQGGIDLRDGLPVYEPFYLLEFVPYGLNPRGKRCLVVGAGAGIIPMWYEARGIRTDVVDINPDIIDTAREHFGFRVSGEVSISDARLFLNRATNRYDYVILDVFSGDTTPGHILSVESLRTVKDRMTPDGVLGINLIGSLRKNNFMTASILRTVAGVFRTVMVYPIASPEEGKGWGNILVFAHDGPPVPFRPESVRDFPVHPRAI